MTLLASAGWSSQNIGDFVQGRAVEAIRTDDLLERLKALQAQRKGIVEGRSVKVIETTLRDRCGRDCRRTLATAKAAAEQRDQLDGQIAELSGKLQSAKPVASADTGAAIVATWLHVEPGQVAGARLAGLTVLPATSGLLFSLAFCGGAPSRREQEQSNGVASPTDISTAPQAVPVNAGMAAPPASEPKCDSTPAVAACGSPPAASSRPRRYWHQAEKRERLLAEIAKDPNRSNVAISLVVGCDPKTVEKYRGVNSAPLHQRKDRTGRVGGGNRRAS
jgi:hypothetical protein